MENPEKQNIDASDCGGTAPDDVLWHSTKRNDDNSEQTLGLDKELSKTDKPMIRWTAALTLSTFILTFFSGLQSYEMHLQLEEMRVARDSSDQSTAAQLAVMSKQAVAMNGQLERMKEASQQTERSLIEANRLANAVSDEARMLREESRPFVNLEQNTTPERGEDNVVQNERRLNNAGKTFALHVQRIFHDDLEVSLPFIGAFFHYPTDDELLASKVDSVIAPGGHMDIVTTSEQRYSEELWNKLLKGDDHRVWVEWGTIRYQDGDGKAYHIWVCNMWDGHSPRTFRCPRGNNAD